MSLLNAAKKSITVPLDYNFIFTRVVPQNYYTASSLHACVDHAYSHCVICTSRVIYTCGSTRMRLHIEVRKYALLTDCRALPQLY